MPTRRSRHHDGYRGSPRTRSGLGRERNHSRSPRENYRPRQRQELPRSVQEAPSLVPRGHGTRQTNSFPASISTSISSTTMRKYLRASNVPSNLTNSFKNS